MQKSQIRLDGWVAIAAYLNRSEKTLRRLEKKNRFQRLPREGTGKRASVYAFTHQLDKIDQALWPKAEDKRNSVVSELQPRIPKSHSLQAACLVLGLFSSLFYLKMFSPGPKSYAADVEVQHERWRMVDQYGNPHKSWFNLPADYSGMEHDNLTNGYLTWFPELDPEPAIIEIMTAPPGNFLIHRWKGRSTQHKVFGLAVIGGDELIFNRVIRLYRLKSTAYDGLGILLESSSGFYLLQILNRNLNIIAELLIQGKSTALAFNRDNLYLLVENEGFHVAGLCFWDVLRTSKAVLSMKSDDSIDEYPKVPIKNISHLQIFQPAEMRLVGDNLILKNQNGFPELKFSIDLSQICEPSF